MVISVPYEELDSLFPLLPLKTVPGAKSKDTYKPLRKYSGKQLLFAANAVTDIIIVQMLRVMYLFILEFVVKLESIPKPQFCLNDKNSSQNG